jgi:hypothetical protein
MNVATFDFISYSCLGAPLPVHFTFPLAMLYWTFDIHHVSIYPFLEVSYESH